MTERKCTCNKLFSILVRGPNTENFEKKFYRQCKLGRGPNIEAGGKSAYNNVQVGWDDEINFAKISFLSHSLEPTILIYVSHS
ncbi:hypothetical protein QP64_09920 [Staphylococcus aureus]|nr:hypothetical protein QP64_09920 [Staphylococcus aureus]